MPSGFTQPANDRLAQLAHNAFEEEQYDLGVQCINQLASLGWHPTSELIRSLFAVSLCTLPESSSSAKGKGRSYGHAPNYSRKVVDTAIGPGVECIIAATRLLEHLSAIAGSDVILKAIVPGGGNDEKQGTSRSDVNHRNARNSAERGSGDDDIGNYTVKSSILGTYLAEMKDCNSFWQVLGLGDMMQNAEHKRKAKRQGGTHRSTTRSREGQGDFLCREEYDREAVWRAVEMLLQVLQADGDSLQGKSSKLARLIHSQATDKKRNGLARHPSQIGAAADIGDVFEIIHAGLAPASLIRPLKRDLAKSSKYRISERYRRGIIAAELLSKLSSLMRDGIIERQALLRRSSDLLGKIDHIALKIVFQTMRRAESSIEIVAAALQRLRSLQIMEDARISTKQFLDALNRLKRCDGKLQDMEMLLTSMQDPTWLMAHSEDDDEESMMDMFWISESGRNIDTLGRDKEVVALLEGQWEVGGSVKGGHRLKSMSPDKITWGKLAFATAWRHATMQRMTSTLILKTEVLSVLGSHAMGLPDAAKSKVLDVVKEAFIILEAHSTQTIQQMTHCCTQMSSLVDQKIEQGSDLSQDIDEEDHSGNIKFARRNITACHALCEFSSSEVNMIQMLTLNQGFNIGSNGARQQRSSEEMQEVQMSL